MAPLSHRTAAAALLTGLMALSACGREAPPTLGDAPASPSPPLAAPSIPDDAPLVIFLGDSIAAGLHLSPDRAFPGVLQRRLAAKGRPFRLVNAGVSGDTTSGGRARLDWLLKQTPAVVVVELGANDGFRGVPAATVEGNLRDIVERAQGAGAKVLLLGMRLPPNYGAVYGGEFARAYERVAEGTGAAFVEFFLEGVAGRGELNLPDGIHPTAEGHEVLAGNVEGELEGLLE